MMTLKARNHRHWVMPLDGQGDEYGDSGTLATLVAEVGLIDGLVI